MTRARRYRNMIERGMLVRVRETVEDVFYSEYAGNPKMILTPDITGSVGSIRVPVVCRTRDPKLRRPFDEYVCVDFLEPQTEKIQRASVSYDNLILVEEGTQP